MQSSIHTVSVSTVGIEDSLRASDRYYFIIFIFLMYMLSGYDIKVILAA